MTASEWFSNVFWRAYATITGAMKGDLRTTFLHDLQNAQKMLACNAYPTGVSIYEFLCDLEQVIILWKGSLDQGVTAKEVRNAKRT